MTALFILLLVIGGGFLLSWVCAAFEAAAIRRARTVEAAFDQSVHCRVVDGQ